MNTLAKELQGATADLYQINAGVGLARFGLLGGIFVGLVIGAWQVENLWIFMAITAIAGLAYAFWLICTHDMVHRTLTGWHWFDTLMPRLISYPMLWPYGLYAELHRLHHGWNGANLADPERVQWTWEEYQDAPPVVQWYVRHQWAIDIFGLGGVGLIVKTILHAWRWRQLVPRLRLQFWIDGLGMVIIQSGLLRVALHQGELWRYLLFWLILERVIGMVIQTRDHLEHYALWGKASSHQLTQLYASRNVSASPFVGWLMGGLNYHALHHAFPEIPFNHLPEAFQRVQAILPQHGLPPMKVEPGYRAATLYWSQHPALIDLTRSEEATGRNRMITIDPSAGLLSPKEC